MVYQNVYAILIFPTTTGRIRKCVPWKEYEERASLTPSKNSKDAYAQFMEQGNPIINASIDELGSLESISFYVESRYPSINNKVRHEDVTDAIIVFRINDSTVELVEE